MLAHYLDGPTVEPWDGTGGHPQVRKIHWPYQLQDDGPVVFIARDPMDNAYSAWQYFLRSYAEEDWLMMQFLHRRWSVAWRMWPHGWRELHEIVEDVPTVRTTYKHLYYRRCGEIARIVTALGFNPDHVRSTWAARCSTLVGSVRDRYDGPGQVEPYPGRNVFLMGDAEKTWITEYLDGFDYAAWGLDD
jgi:hypothetical protein